MIVPCDPNHLFWETHPDGLALYPFARRYDEREGGWLHDEAVLLAVDRLDSPTVYVDLGRTNLISGVAISSILKLCNRARHRGGRVILCNVRPALQEIFQIINLIPKLTSLGWLFVSDEGVPGGAKLPDPAWLAWGGGIVAALARTVQEGQDFDLLPVLGDALEDAGCTLREVLDH